MIDIHAHFSGAKSDFAAEWEKIRVAGVDRVIYAGDNLDNSFFHRNLARLEENCYCTVGIHPENAARQMDREDVEDFLSVGRDSKCVAVGEIGLDYHYEGYDKTAQRELFCRQIELADLMGLPLQIHSRDACEDTLAILREQRQRLKKGFVMHCYAYGKENLETFLSLGGYFSFGGVVCFKNARRVVESVEICPVERILSETDSPYLSPFRGEKNSPANIPVIVKKLAEIKGIPFDEMNAIIDDNALRIFFKIS